MPIGSTLAHCWLAGLFVQGIKVLLLEALLGVGWAGLRQLVWVGSCEGFPAPSLGGCERVTNIQGLLEDGAGCGWTEKEEKINLSRPCAHHSQACRVGSGVCVCMCVCGGVNVPSSLPPLTPGLFRDSWRTLRDWGSTGETWAHRFCGCPYLCSPRYPWPGWGWEVPEDLRKLRCSARGKGCRGDCPGAPGAGDLMAICLGGS